MHILIIAQQWSPEEGTPQRRWAWLTRELVEAGNTVDVITPAPHYPVGHSISDAPEDQPGAVAPGRSGERVWRTKFKDHDQTLFSRLVSQGYSAAVAIVTARKVVRSRKPDVVLTTAPPIPAVHAAAFVSMMTRTPLIVDLRDAWPDLLKYMQQWSDSTTRRGLRARIKDVLFKVAAAGTSVSMEFILSRAAGIVTTAPSFAERLRKKGYSHTISVRNLGTQRGRQLSAAPKDHDSLNILYAGTIGRAQGLSNVLRAASRVKNSGGKINLRFVGGGAHVDTLRASAEERGLDVEFFGRVSFEEVLEHYEWSDSVLVHLADWEPLSYTVPSKLYEVLELGRHISGSINGETARIIEESETGFAVPSMDPDVLAAQWIELAAHRERLDVSGRGMSWLRDRGTMDENGRKFVEFVNKIVEENKCRGR